ncbi:chemosensory receptor A [Elysia marginata]|uniref:Chemosensory receptor A n=1 Tax=Elysia marginata TaxID=1093978 RepID=A0AAV4H851_9GAST|nr:chemosensory receptor A [Elysia marginata]
MAEFALHNQSSQISDTNWTITDQDKMAKSLMNIYSVLPVLSWTLIGTGFLGIPGNLLTFVVFFKMGFSNNLHISCAALAVSDACCVVAGMLCGLTVMDVFRQHFEEQSFYHFSNLFGGVAYTTFSRITALITAWISLERCLCVVVPFRFRLIITRKLTAVVLGTIFTLSLSFMAFAFTAFSFDSKTDPRTNSTVWIFRYDKASMLKEVREIVVFLFGMTLPAVSWATVTICTSLLTFKLTQSSKWRSHNVSVSTVWSVSTPNTPQTRKQRLLVKERRTTKITVIIAGIFLVCSAPSSAHLLTIFILPEYGVSGSLWSLFLANGLICVFMSQLNSSINIIVFAALGHNFRSTLRRVLYGTS